MTGSSDNLADICRRLDELTNLFRRRLLDDREKRQTIDLLRAQLEESERARAVEALRPLVTRLAQVVDRLEAEGPFGSDLFQSIAEELRDVLASIGVHAVAVEGEVDTRRHEILAVEDGVGPVMTISQVIRGGFEKDGVVIRPAQVTVVRAETPFRTARKDI